MVGSGQIEIIDGLQVIRKKFGSGTGDFLYKTADGRWWEKWDGIIRTGQQVASIKIIKLRQ